MASRSELGVVIAEHEASFPRSQYQPSLGRNSIYLTIKPLIRSSTSTASTPTPSTPLNPSPHHQPQEPSPFPFLSLPLEIRREIYAFALTPPPYKSLVTNEVVRDIRLFSRYRTTATVNTGLLSSGLSSYTDSSSLINTKFYATGLPAPGLLFVNRRINAEATEFVYGCNAFQFDEARCVGMFLDDIGPLNASFIRGPISILWLDWSIESGMQVPRIPQWCRTVRLLSPLRNLAHPVTLDLNVWWREYVRCFGGLGTEYAALKGGVRIWCMNFAGYLREGEGGRWDATGVVRGEGIVKRGFWGKMGGYVHRCWGSKHTIFCNSRCNTPPYTQHEPLTPPFPPAPRHLTFLNLPPAVRRKIYTHLIRPSQLGAPLLILYEYGYFHRTSHHPLACPNPVYPAILRTCRTISDEARKVLYSENRLVLCGGNPLLFLNLIGPVNEALLRDVEIRYGSPVALRRDVPVLREALLRLAQLPGVRKVEVRVFLLLIPYLFSLRNAAKTLHQNLGDDFSVLGVMDGVARDVREFMWEDEPVGWDFESEGLRPWRVIVEMVEGVGTRKERVGRAEELVERRDLWVEERGEKKGGTVSLHRDVELWIGG